MGSFPETFYDPLCFRVRWIFKKNGLVLLFKTRFRNRNCFLSSFATDGKDGHTLGATDFSCAVCRFGQLSACDRHRSIHPLAGKKNLLYPGKDGLSEHGLKLEKVGPTFSSFKAMPANISITNKYYV